MLGLRIWQHWKYEKIAQGAEYARKTQEKVTPHENILDFFLLDTFKTTFWMKNTTQLLTQSVWLSVA